MNRAFLGRRSESQEGDQDDHGRRPGIGFLGAGLIFVRRDSVRGTVLNEATRRGFAIDDQSAESVGDHDTDGKPPMVAVTMRVHGKRSVSELASALTELDLVDAVVATDHTAADD